KMARLSYDPTKDPWARRHAWRLHPAFSLRSSIFKMAPGLGIATVLFAGYMAYNKFGTSSKH
ncbi:hypothetical protein BB560_005072, partial [Smittium megazygosporum]